MSGKHISLMTFSCSNLRSFMWTTRPHVFLFLIPLVLQLIQYFFIRDIIFLTVIKAIRLLSLWNIRCQLEQMKVSLTKRNIFWVIGSDCSFLFFLCKQPAVLVLQLRMRLDFYCRNTHNHLTDNRRVFIQVFCILQPLNTQSTEWFCTNITHW